MTPTLHQWLSALILELKDRYALKCLLDDLASDPRRLEDLGLQFDEIKAQLQQAQRDESPLRHLVRDHARGRFEEGFAK
jgi:hypothetical protein